MAKATKDQATEAGFETAGEYNRFLTSNEISHDGFMSLSEQERGEYHDVWNGTYDTPDSEDGEDSESETAEKRDLSPSALGFDVNEVKDVPDDELPDFTVINSKYKEYFKALRDSHERGVWKHVSGVADVELMERALRNAASKLKLGLDVRTTTDDNDQPDGNLYFKARDKRAKAANGAAESDETD